MLGIHQSYGEAAVQYFTQALSTEGYYLDDEITATWEGKGSEILGLNMEVVSKETFTDLVNNISPITKERLTVRNAENRRAGFDFTFSAPKSVSIAFAITKDPAILEAHQKAYRKAMQAIEDSMQTQANTEYSREYQHTGNIIFAAFDHFTSRPCEIEKNGKKLFISDPQMHTHCYVPNITYNENKKRFQALEVGNIHRLAPFYEAVYHAHLSLELNHIGLQTRRTNERYELHISRDIIERFSNRSKIIEAYAKENNITDPQALSEIATKTRHSKGKAIKESELYKHWEERLSSEELQSLKELKNKTHEKSKPLSAKEAVDRALSHFLERNSTAQEKRVLAEALRLSYGTLLPQDVQKELGSRDNIIRSDIDTISIITTVEMVQAEDRMIELATSGKSIIPAENPDFKPKQDFFNQQQQNAIKVLLSSNDQFIILRGAAGVGKTSLQLSVKEGVELGGKSFFGVAPSSQAAKVLRQKGFEAETVAALLANPKLQEQLKNNVLLVDEAGMCGVKNLTQIMEIAKTHNSRVILSGDTRQHGPPAQYGDALRILQDLAKLETATVQKIVRQKPKEYRIAIEKLGRGQTLEGYQALNKIGALKEIPDHEERLNEIADDYIESTIQKRSALIVSPTHYEGDLINQLVREKLKSKGRIQRKEISFPTLKNLSFTESQKKDLVNYQEGQVIRFTRDQKGGFKAGSHYEVISSKKLNDVRIRDLNTDQVLKLPYDQNEHFQVYKKTETKLAKGDLLRLTNNTKTVEGSKAFNGTTYEVKGFTKSGIKLTNGKTLPKDNYHFKYGYSETSHSSQGKDAKDVYISMSDMSFAATNEQAFYVAASRGTHSVSIYTSSKDDLKRSIVKSGERLTAREIAEKQDERVMRRKKRIHHRTLNEKQRGHVRNQNREKQTSRGVSREL